MVQETHPNVCLPVATFPVMTACSCSQLSHTAFSRLSHSAVSAISCSCSEQSHVACSRLSHAPSSCQEEPGGWTRELDTESRTRPSPSRTRPRRRLTWRTAPPTDVRWHTSCNGTISYSSHILQPMMDRCEVSPDRPTVMPVATADSRSREVPIRLTQHTSSFHNRL